MTKLDTDGQLLIAVRSIGFQIDEVALEMMLHVVEKAKVERDSGNSMTMEDVGKIQKEVQAFYKAPPPPPS